MHKHGSEHSSGHVDPNQVFDEPFWNARYSEKDRIWSGNPNPQLVVETADLPPGAALDVGCGEGADALWLAERGWRVTAVDISSVALTRAAEHEATLNGDHPPVTWAHQDLTESAPPSRAFDLVTAQYMHLPAAQRDPLFRHLADAVAPGGTLLIVGHDASDLEAHEHRPSLPDLYFTAEDILKLLGPGWETMVAEVRPREASGPDGAKLAVADTVYRGRRAG